MRFVLDPEATVFNGAVKGMTESDFSSSSNVLKSLLKEDQIGLIRVARSFRRVASSGFISGADRNLRETRGFSVVSVMFFF